MIKRFTGRGGKARLVEALQHQFLVAGDRAVAVKLARNAVLCHLRSDYKLVTEGDTDNDVYFILSGSASVRVNGREVASRAAGEHVGEMALVDTTAVRSATVRTREATVVAKVCESQFTRIANKHPSLWRRMAVALAKRLRERNKFQTPPRTEPVIFIGSSSEGLSVAKCIQKYLLRHPFVPRIWSDGVFECSKTTIEDLMQITKETDFAVLVLTPDDVTKSRGKNKPSPRDNVVFEMGLFMGALSRERTYIVAPRKLDIKIPTDLLGVKCLLYQERRGRSLARNLQPVFRDLRRLISKHGPM